MASNATSLFCILFILSLTLSFFHQTQARDSTLFSKFSRKPTTTTTTTETTKETTTSVNSPSATQAESPESSPFVEEHGYGLYGRENNNYHYSPTTTDPVKTRHVEDDKFVSLDEIRNEMRKNGKNGYVGEKQGMSDTRFLENGKYYYDINQDVVKDENSYKGNNGYESSEKMGMSEQVEEENKYPRNSERQGMSDTRFLENGRYYHDINQDNNNNVKVNNNNGYEAEKSEHVEEENGYYPENQGNNGYGVSEKQGMSDLENRRYHYDLDEEEEVKNEEIYPKKNNGYVTEKQGMSDTRFLENGKYFYDINAEVAKGENNNHYYNEKSNNYEQNEGFENSKNNEYENDKYEEVNNNNGYEARGQNYNPNEYLAHETEGYHGRTKNLPPNQYDTMEEYEKEEEYRLSHKYNP